MNLKETAEDSVMDLINTYTSAPKGRKRKVNVLHNNFEDLPKDTRRLIEGVLAEVYLGDFEIIRKAFVDKLEFFLRLVFNSLVEAKCIDDELLGKIEETREKIANVVNEVEVSDADIKWLKKIGFLPVDVFEFASKYDIVDVIFELRENIDEYKLILGDYKYIVKILKMHEGLYKLKRLISFYRNYDKDLIKFNGSHLSQIVVNSDWEEKLKYFEDPDKLKRLTDVGFNGYHLSQIVVGSDWEEKLRIITTEDCLVLLREGRFTYNSLTKLLLKKDWRKRLKALGVKL